jgi:hypothetical protein
MIFSTDFSETFVILRRIQRDMIIYLGRFTHNLTIIKNQRVATWQYVY